MLLDQKGKEIMDDKEIEFYKEMSDKAYAESREAKAMADAFYLSWTTGKATNKCRRVYDNWLHRQPKGSR